MINSFSCKDTERLYREEKTSRFGADVAKAAMRKLAMLGQAKELKTLRIPPGNRLEALKGKRKGQYSIRINDQWRVCFKWHEGNADEVEIVDYH